MVLKLLTPILVNFDFVLETGYDKFCVLLEVFELLHEVRPFRLFCQIAQVIVNTHIFKASEEFAVFLLAWALEKHPVDERERLYSKFDVVRLKTP